MSDTGIRFQRANFVVSDLERSLTFYRDILGMEVNYQKQSAADSYSYDVFEIDRAAVMNFAVLATSDQPRVMALTELKGIELPPVPAPRRAAIVLDVADIDGVVAASKHAGLHVYEEDHLVTNDGREGREVGIVDFDDNLVVIYHITKAAAE
ncbi:VOC family protein [Halioglobus maricola]|nr:VOC family protein [Halioglobus maricola]